MECQAGSIVDLLLRILIFQLRFLTMEVVLIKIFFVPAWCFCLQVENAPGTGEERN